MRKDNIFTARKKNRLPADMRKASVAANDDGHSVDWEALLAGLNGGRHVVEYGADRNIFRQGQPAGSLFYLRRGEVKLSVTSKQGKEAILAVLHAGDFFGEGCLAGQQLRIATAISISDCTLMKINKQAMARMLHEHQDISEMFAAHLLSRNMRYEEDLLDQIFNSSEKRLARTLLVLAHYGMEPRSETVVPRINQIALAQMVGITRTRVSHFMNRFKKLGFIDYEGVGLTVNNGLLSVVLND